MKSGWSCAVAVAGILLSVSSLQAQGLPNGFQKSLQQYSFRYSIPPGFSATQVIDNQDVKYDFAVKSSTQKLEIRYSILPIIGGNQDLDVMVVTMALNISDGQMVQPKDYPDADVKSEFGADGGCSAIVQSNSEFGKGFKYCLISAIHRDNVANAYAFFLFDDPNVAMKAIFTDKVYHALRFK